MPKLRVLIVDDNSDVRRLFAIGLNQHGFEVKLAANGAEAVERIQEEQPDVIVLDWLLAHEAGHDRGAGAADPAAVRLE